MKTKMLYKVTHCAECVSASTGLISIRWKANWEGGGGRLDWCYPNWNKPDYLKFMLSSVQGPFKVGCCCLSLQALGADWLSHYLGHLFARGAALIHHFPTLQEPSSHPDVRPSYQLIGYMWLSQVETKHDYIAHIVRMSPAFNARSALQCFKHINVSKISNRINVQFLPWTATH